MHPLSKTLKSCPYLPVCSLRRTWFQLICILAKSLRVRKAVLASIRAWGFVSKSRHHMPLVHWQHLRLIHCKDSKTIPVSVNSLPKQKTAYISLV